MKTAMMARTESRIESRNPDSIALRLGGTASEQVQHQRNYGDDQEQVDRASYQMKPDPHY
jgi:hypothetical protein